MAADERAPYEVDDAVASAGTAAAPPTQDDRLRRAVDAVAAVLDGPVPDDLEAAAVRDRVAQLERLRGLADAASAMALSALRARGGVGDDGAGSTAEWLRANTRRSGRDAARLARLATDLPDLPGTARALSDGDMTAEAADVLVGVVRDGRLGGAAEVEADLLDVARTASPERLRADVRRRRQGVDPRAMLDDEQRQRDRRRAHLSRADDGMWDLHARLPDELGQRARTLLAAHDRSRPDPDGRDPRRPEQRLADALGAVVDSMLDHGRAPATGGVARPHLSVIVPYETVAADLADRDATLADGGATGRPSQTPGAAVLDDSRWADLAPGELEWGGYLSPQAVRRLLCDAAVSRIVVSGESQVLDVGRATRSWSEPQRRAVNSRDRGCRGPSCTRPIGWTNIHHVRWWERDDGPTDVANGLALCHHCHHLVHDRGWEVELDASTATATWTAPDGRVRVTTPGRVVGHGEEAVDAVPMARPGTSESARPTRRR